jgi:nitric oxide reductase subunit B
MIVGGVLPFIWIAWTALRNFRSGSTVQELPEHPLYTEYPAPSEAGARTAKD